MWEKIDVFEEKWKETTKKEGIQVAAKRLRRARIYRQEGAVAFQSPFLVFCIIPSSGS
jgi:hypothetical protein